VSNLLKVRLARVVHIFAAIVSLVRIMSDSIWRWYYVNLCKNLHSWTIISVWNTLCLVLVLFFGGVLGLFEDTIRFSNWRYLMCVLRLGYHDLIGYGWGGRTGFKIEGVCGFIFLFFVWWVQRMLKSNWWVSMLANICIVVITFKISEFGCVWM
jgi:hypothetical protein